MYLLVFQISTHAASNPAQAQAGESDRKHIGFERLFLAELPTELQRPGSR